MNRLRSLSVVISVFALVIAGCSSSVTQGEAKSPVYDPFRAGGLPAQDGPSGVKDGAPAPEGDVQNTDNGDIDKLSLLAVNDIAEFWEKPAPSGPAVWKRAAAWAVGVFVVLMAVVTGVEVVAGRPVSDLVRGDSGGGTSFFGHDTVTTTTKTVPPTAPTVYVTVTPKVVVTTPTVTQTAPASTATTPAPTTGASTSVTPSTPTAGTPSATPSSGGSSTP